MGPSWALEGPFPGDWRVQVRAMPRARATRRASRVTADQIRWAQLNLTPGMFIGQVGEGPWRYPFVFRVPERLPNPGSASGGVGGARQLAMLPTVSA